MENHAKVRGLTRHINCKHRETTTTTVSEKKKMAIFDRSIDVNNFSGLLRNCLKKWKKMSAYQSVYLKNIKITNFCQKMLHIHTIVYNMLSMSLPCEMAKNSTPHFLIVSKDLNVCFHD